MGKGFYTLIFGNDNEVEIGNHQERCLIKGMYLHHGSEEYDQKTAYDEDRGGCIIFGGMFLISIVIITVIKFLA